MRQTGNSIVFFGTHRAVEKEGDLKTHGELEPGINNMGRTWREMAKDGSAGSELDDAEFNSDHCFGSQVH